MLVFKWPDRERLVWRQGIEYGGDLQQLPPGLWLWEQEDMEGGKGRNTEWKRCKRMGGPHQGGKVARINLRQILWMKDLFRGNQRWSWISGKTNCSWWVLMKCILQWVDKVEFDKVSLWLYFLFIKEDRRKNNSYLDNLWVYLVSYWTK